MDDVISRHRPFLQKPATDIEDTCWYGKSTQISRVKPERNATVKTVFDVSEPRSNKEEDQQNGTKKRTLKQESESRMVEERSENLIY